MSWWLRLWRWFNATEDMTRVVKLTSPACALECIAMKELREEIRETRAEVRHYHNVVMRLLDPGFTPPDGTRLSGATGE